MYNYRWIDNLLKHDLDHNHEAIRDEETIQEIFKKTNSNAGLLPVILRTDPTAKLIRLAPGNICKIMFQ